MRLSRRQILKLLAGTGAAAAVPQVALAEAASAATVLSGASYASKFTRALPLPTRIDLTGTTKTASITAAQASLQVLTGFPRTNCYVYGGSWPGPTIVTTANSTATVTWRNGLPIGTVKLSAGGHLLPVDASLLEADMVALPAGQKPMVTHLHGAHAEWQSDGHPEAWFTQNNTRGTQWQKAAYTYDNSQLSANLWYHDHSMGLTRLNAYAGMTGMYLIRDSVETNLVSTRVLPAAAFETETVITDRSFTDDGQLRLPTATTPAGGISGSIFTDFMLVNGAPWPVMSVEPRKYRFRMLNACDSRILLLTLSTGGNFLVVGTDQGLLNNAVATNRLLMAPGERYDVVLDFTGVASGTRITLQNRGLDGVLQGFRNTAGTVTNRPADNPFGFSNRVANTNSTGQIMRFTVNKALTATPNATVVANTKLTTLASLTPTVTRRVMTYFGTDGTGRQMELLGSIPGGSAMWGDAVTENVKLGTTEIWEIYNTGPVAHPVHIHLVNFQVLDRASFTFTTTPKTMADGGTGANVTVTGTGTRRAPETYERGRKDVVMCYPNEVTRVQATFDRAGNYVWHCHILHHEDHGMMRPVTVA